MADDPQFRSLFRSLEGGDESPGIDVRAVVRRSRRRRLPAQLGVGAAGLAIVGVLVVAIGAGTSGLGSAGSSDSMAGSAPEMATEGGSDATTLQTDAGAESSEDSLKRAPAEKLNLCAGELAEVAPSSSGLILTPVFDAAPEGATSVTGTVVLSNTGATTVSGSTALYPAITLSQDGITVWHSNGGMDAAARVVDLAPGESLEYEATFEPVRCSVEDDLGESFPDDLPRLEFGDYEVSAAIVFHPDDADAASEGELVTGPRQTITIR